MFTGRHREGLDPGDFAFASAQQETAHFGAPARDGAEPGQHFRENAVHGIEREVDDSIRSGKRVGIVSN